MRALLFIFFLTSLGWANPTSFDKEFESKLFPHASKLVSPNAGDPEKTMRLVQELYRIAGPKIGCRLVEPVYLLVLGDQRPYGSWNGFMIDPQPEDDAVIEKLNAHLLPRGYSIHPRKQDKQGRVAAFSLRSLAGLEKRTLASRLSWVPRYHRHTGWPGYYQWKSDIYKAMPQERENDAFHFAEGIMLGYPDAAVEHFNELAYDNWPTTVDATIPSASYYLNGMPIFNLRASDADDPAVIATEQQWESFLQACYQTPAHRELEKDPRFIEERLRRHAHGRQTTLFSGDGRYSEARRLGLIERRLGQVPLNSEHERWLSRNLPQILEAFGATPDLVEVAKLGCEVELTSNHLWSWLLRGSFEEDTEAGQLYREFSQRYPLAYANLYRRELDDRTRHALQRAQGESLKREARPLADLLGSNYLREQLSGFPLEEQLQTFQAVDSRKTYPRLQQIIAEANQGRGPYAELLKELRKDHPELWHQEP